MSGPHRYQHPEYPEKDTLPFFPNYIILEVIVSLGLLAVLVVLATLLPAGLEDKADPLHTPPGIKPEWYFLWVYQFLKVPSLVVGPGVAGELLGVFIPAIGILLLILLPFLDRKAERRPSHRRLAMVILALIVAIIVALSIWGRIS